MRLKDLLGRCAAVALVTMLVGCGGGSTDQGTIQPQSGVATTATTQAATPTDTPGLGAEPPTALEQANAPKALFPDEIDQIDDDVNKVAGALPVRVMLSGLPPVRDQGKTNACGAFSFGYGLTSFLASKARATSITADENQVSAAFMYRVALKAKGISTCGYTSASNYFPYLIKNGSASWKSVPFPEADIYGGIDCGLFTDIDVTTQQPEYKQLALGSWQALSDGSSVQEIKGFLNEGKPVVGLYNVCRDLAQTKTGVYTASLALTGGRHFMLIVGYDDDIAYTDADGNPQKGALRVMNSWGTRYHDQGFLWIAYPAHTSTCYYAYTAEAAQTVALKPSGGELAATATAAKMPSGQIVQAVQATAFGRVDLVLQYQFSDWVNVNTVSLTSPSGVTLTQTLHDLDTRTGYVYFRRADGRQFEAGAYKVAFDVDSADAAGLLLQTTCQVATLAGALVPGPLGADLLGTDGQAVQLVP